MIPQKVRWLRGMQHAGRQERCVALLLVLSDLAVCRAAGVAVDARVLLGSAASSGGKPDAGFLFVLAVRACMKCSEWAPSGLGVIHPLCCNSIP